MLGAQRRKYKKAWNAAETPIRCRWVDIGGGKKEEELPRLTALELREASCSFGHDTAEAYDGFHVSVFRLLDDEGLEALSLIDRAIETKGNWPT